MSTPPALYLLDPAVPVPAWHPFAGARPIADLRAGALRIRERWSLALGVPCTGIIAAPVGTFFTDIEALPLTVGSALTGPCIVARSDLAPRLAPITLAPETRRLVHEGETVAWVLDAGARWPVADEGAAQAIDGLRLRGAYDLVTALEQLLPADLAALGPAVLHLPPPHPIVLGELAQLFCGSAMVEPGVVFDLRNGPIVIEPDVEIRHGCRLEGPLFVGRGSRLMGGDLRGSSIGPRCTVRGEVSTSCFIGYANKGHEGFVGHSVLGHWVNLGAGTTTSNLKNTYGTVRLDARGTAVATDRQFLGTIFGDHAKTAIGTMCSTGTLVGTGANVFGGPPPKSVRPFAWGSTGNQLLEREGFLKIAARVLPRRQISWSDAHAATLGALYDRLVGT